VSFELVIIEGPQIGRRFPVGNVPMTFGRSPAAQLSFPQDNFISGNHLTVQSDGRSVLLTDLRSTNGTFLNGQRIGQAIANIGDTIKIGSMTLQVVFTQDPAPVPQQYFPPVPVVAQATTVMPTFARQPPPPLPRMDVPLPPAMDIPAPPAPYPPFDPQAAPPAPYPPFDPQAAPPPPYPPFDPQAAPPPQYPGSTPSFAGSAPPFPEAPAASPPFPPFPGASGTPAPAPPDTLGSFQVGSSAFADIEPSPLLPPFPEPPAPAPPPPEPLPLIALRTIREIPGPIFGLLNPLADPAVGELLRDANADLAGYCLASSGDPFAPTPAWAPYLLPLAGDGEVLRQIVEKGWGAGWAAFLTSPVSYEELRTHFKKFVAVQLQSGAEPYFRFWEPPVLRNFFEAANPGELTMFCGPVREWILEADPSTSLWRAHNTPAGLSKSVVPLS
jgi:hypothetical protein